MGYCQISSRIQWLLINTLRAPHYVRFMSIFKTACDRFVTSLLIQFRLISAYLVVAYRGYYNWLIPSPIHQLLHIATMDKFIVYSTQHIDACVNLFNLLLMCWFSGVHIAYFWQYHLKTLIAIKASVPNTMGSSVWIFSFPGFGSILISTGQVEKLANLNL